MIDDATIARAGRILSNSPPVKLAREIAGEPAETLGQIATRAGFPEVGQAFKTGRIDDIVTAVGADIVEALATEAGRQINRAVDRALGKWGAWLQALDTSDRPPAGEVLLVLGAYMFSVGTAAHQQLARSWEYRWAAQERIGRRPSRQFVGAGEEKITLDGYTLPMYARNADPLALLRTMAAEGEPYILVDHFGKVFGTYCIVHIDETHSELTPVGHAQRIDFKVELVEYGEDAGASAAQGATA